MAKSKFFRVAVEGGDRRAHHHPRVGLNRWPSATTSPPTARGSIWSTIRGYDPNGQFKMYGDITAAKTEEVDMEGESAWPCNADRPHPPSWSN